MNAHWVIAMLALAACETTSAARCASTCGGCCDERGVCQPGTSALQCGAPGTSCATCSSGQFCIQGVCGVPASGGASGQGGGSGGAAGGSGGGTLDPLPGELAIVVHQVRQLRGSSQSPLLIAFTLANGTGGGSVPLNPLLLDVKLASGLIKKPRTTSSRWVDGNAPLVSDALAGGSSYRWVVALDGDATVDAPVQLDYTAPPTGPEMPRRASAPLTLESCTPCGQACTYLDRDPSNCGACGVFDRDGAACVSGQLVACAGGTTRCTMAAGGSACSNLMNDANNCGQCGRVVTGGRVCSNGVPTCATGTTDCGGQCVNLDTNNNHCGQCGHACAPTNHCGVNSMTTVPTPGQATPVGAGGRCAATRQLSNPPSSTCTAICAQAGAQCAPSTFVSSNAGLWGGAYAVCGSTHWFGTCEQTFPASVAPCASGFSQAVCNCVL